MGVLSWANRIVTASNDDIWAYLPKAYMLRVGDDYLILKTTFTKQTLFPDIKTIPAFYQDIIVSYNTSKIITLSDLYEQIKTQPLWGNRFILFKKKTLFFRSWIKEGILTISNLKIKNGKLDIGYLYNRITDKRNFHAEINILSKALQIANVKLSNEHTEYTTIPIHIHNT